MIASRRVLSISIAVLLSAGSALAGWTLYANYKAQVEAEANRRHLEEEQQAMQQEIAERNAEVQRERASNPAIWGVDSNFEDFFVAVRTSGLETGKRFRFRATPSSADGLEELCKSGRPGGTSCLPAVADFDDSEQLKALLKRLFEKYNTICTVVVSLRGDGQVHINRADECD